ncbi:similar to An14g00150 [Aspergillus luchuensis IFO 4308]|nr:similar to An14g00150 [Aspergillus luchuensis IFO 4308]
MRSSYFNFLPALSSLFSLSAAISSSSQPQSAEILCWPVASPEPSVLAHVSYDSTTLQPEFTFSSTNIAAACGDNEPQDVSNDLIRLGLYTSTSTNTKQWVGTLASRSSLIGSENDRPTLRLHVGPSNNIYYVDLLPSISSTSSSTPPIVLGPDGKNAEEVVEKTIFQKYWWVFLIVTFLAMSGGGESQ